jgi:hypothetical protein
MRWSSAIVFGGIGLGIGVYVVVRSLNPSRSIFKETTPKVHLTTADLDFPQVSHEEIISERLVDLNKAAASELRGLGLDEDNVQRVIENRPYRSRLELVSRMVLSEAIFSAIRNRVAISEGRDPVKVA